MVFRDTLILFNVSIRRVSSTYFNQLKFQNKNEPAKY